jgi:hypothetical protein
MKGRLGCENRARQKNYPKKYLKRGETKRKRKKRQSKKEGKNKGNENHDVQAVERHPQPAEREDERQHVADGRPDGAAAGREGVRVVAV